MLNATASALLGRLAFHVASVSLGAHTRTHVVQGRTIPSSLSDARWEHFPCYIDLSCGVQMRPALSRTTRRTQCFARSWRNCTARCTSRSSCSTPRHRRPLHPSLRRLCRRWCAQRASARRARPSSLPPGSRPSAPSTRECSSASRSSRRARSSSRTSTRSRSDKYVLCDNTTVLLVILVSYMLRVHV